MAVAVLDDGSDDGTSSLQFNFPTVQWHRWGPKRGLLEARNRLMRTELADYYLSLDDDAWFVDKDEIAVAIEYLETHPGVAAVAFDILSPDRPTPTERCAPRPTSMFIGCGHVLRISAVREAGFYIPSPGYYGSEEKDLCLRFLERGWEVHLLLGVHVWHDKTIVARDRAVQHRSSVCNDLAFALRRCPFPMVLIVLPFKMLSHLRFALSHGHLKQCIAGFSLFFRHARSVWTNRNPVRAKTFQAFLRRSHEVS
jgi:GT2 family glycosyltransferase